MKNINELWVLVYGTTIGELHTWMELVSYDEETGEGIYEHQSEIGWNPREEVKEVFTNLEAAREALEKEVHKFEEGHRWPWNIPHCSFGNNEMKVEYTDNEDSVWWAIRHMKQSDWAYGPFPFLFSKNSRVEIFWKSFRD